MRSKNCKVFHCASVLNLLLLPPCYSEVSCYFLPVILKSPVSSSLLLWSLLLLLPCYSEVSCSSSLLLWSLLLLPPCYIWTFISVVSPRTRSGIFRYSQGSRTYFVLFKKDQSTLGIEEKSPSLTSVLWNRYVRSFGNIPSPSSAKTFGT